MASFRNATSPIHPLLSEQNPLLNLLFPSFMPVISSSWPLLTGIPSFYGRLLCICGVLLLFGKYVSEFLGRLVEIYFMSKIEVPYHDEAHDMLISWVSSQPFAQSARTSLAMVKIKSSTHDDGSGLHANDKLLHYSPCNGRSYFWHKHHLFVFERKRSQGEFGNTREETCISYFGRNPGVVRELLDECRRYYLGQIQNKTCVFDHDGSRWRSSKAKNKREISTVSISKQVKQMLLHDVAEFLDPKTRTWYAMRGIPYQHGLLFHGPPGTGKSSFTLSIAGQFGLDVYVLTMSSLNDQSLKTLFAELPERCIVLLEDVDAVGLNRTQDSNAVKPSPNQNGFPSTSVVGKVTMSTLLNVLDGLGSPEGRLLIMTTKHVERLDPALIRPGRADIKVEFQLADEDMISQLFFLAYDPRPNTVINDNQLERDAHQAGESWAIKDCDLPQLAQEFVAKIPKLEFSPAELMSLLLANKQSPRHAIASVDTWTERTREERKRFGKANSWALDGSDEFSDH